MDNNIRDVVAGMLPEVAPEERQRRPAPVLPRDRDGGRRAAGRCARREVGGVLPTVDVLYELHKALPASDDVELRVSEITVTGR